MQRVRFQKISEPPYKYQTTNTVTFSTRYGDVTVELGFKSDGATCAPDIDSDCWWVHDVLCVTGQFDDGTKCTNWQASTVLYDIMRADGFNYFRCQRWRHMTFLCGGGKARENGMLYVKN